MRFFTIEPSKLSPHTGISSRTTKRTHYAIAFKVFEINNLDDVCLPRFINLDCVRDPAAGSPQNEADASFKIEDFAAVVKNKDANADGLLALDEMPDELSKNFFSAVDLDANTKLDAKEWEYFKQSIASKNSMMAIRVGGSGDMTSKSVVWKYFRNIPQLPSPVLAGKSVFMISDQGIVTCLEPRTGEALKRGRLQGASGNVYASPVVADDKLFFITEDGKVAVTDTTSEFKILAVNDLKENCYATPAFDRDRIYIRTEKGLYAFGL